MRTRIVVLTTASALLACSPPMPMRDAGTPVVRDAGVTDRFPVLPAAKARKVAVGNNFACALTTTGTVRCWGAAGRSKDPIRPAGLLGSAMDAGYVPMPVDVPNLADVVDLDAAYDHACAVQSSGAVQCWGSNEWAKLGLELPTDGGLIQGDRPTPAPINGVAGAAKVALGRRHSCVLLQSGGVRCWGGDYLGQLQFRSQEYERSHVPLDMPGISGATELAAFSNQTCAVVAGGAVKCWGQGPVNGSTESTPPYTVPLTGVTALALNESANCAVANGGAKCWGITDRGLLGNGSDTGELEPRMPVDVATLSSGVTAISRQCAVQMGQAKCWGRSGRLLGDGTAMGSIRPVTVVDLSDVVQISANVDVTCAVTGSGQVWCWGDSEEGAVGNGLDVAETGIRFFATPQRVLSFE